ncbi:MAG: TonB family protein [Myxococcota bacterium]
MTARALARQSLLADERYRRRLLWSAVGHLLVGLALLVSPAFSVRPVPPGPVYVELLPAQAPPAAAVAPAPPQIVDEPVVIPPEPKEKPPPKPKPKPQPKPEPEPKPATPASETAEAPKPPARSLDQIMAELRQRRAQDLEPPAGAAVEGHASGVLAGILNRERAEYDRKILALLYSNWAGLSALPRRGELVVRFEVEVGPGGDVRRIRLLQSSGNRFLDESAERAIRRSDPFPPPPPGYTRLAIRFDPAERF